MTKLLVALVTTVAALLAPAGQAAEIYKAGRLLVGPANGADLPKVLAKRQAKIERKLHGIPVYAVKVPPGQEKRIAAALEEDVGVVFAEPDYLGTFAAFNDPLVGSQWHLPKINAIQSRGAGVIIADCDSGVAAHPDLLLAPGGLDLITNGPHTGDFNGHGTKVAGSAAAVANNALGIASPAGAAQILPVRISFPDGTSLTSTMAECVTKSTDIGARVANISFTGAPCSGTVATAAAYLERRGGVTVVAAGNANSLVGCGNNAQIFLVSATTQTDGKASWSNFGPAIDVAAPGVGIYTTNRELGYGAYSGTSFSAPITAGVVAAVIGVRPDLTAAQIKSVIETSARDVGAVGRDDIFGHGIVDVEAAIAAARLVPKTDIEEPPPPVPPEVEPIKVPKGKAWGRLKKEAR